MFENLKDFYHVFYVFKYSLKKTFICNILISIIHCIFLIIFQNNTYKISENNIFKKYLILRMSYQKKKIIKKIIEYVF